MKKYIRFGDIPKNEHSGIYAIDIGKIGEEIGVSCYECIFLAGEYRIILPQNSNIHCCATLGYFLDEYLAGKRKAYLVKGIEVGRGKDCEPLLNHIKKIKEIKL